MGVSGRPKGAKNRKTLDREAKRELYNKLTQELFGDVVGVHTQQALNPRNTKERIEFLHQSIGELPKAVDMNITEYEIDED